MSMGIVIHGFYNGKRAKQDVCAMYATNPETYCCWDKFVELLGFESIETYVNSYPGKFEHGTKTRNRTESWGEVGITFEVSGKTVPTNFITELCSRPGEWCADDDRALQGLLSDFKNVIHSPTIEEFIEYNKFKHKSIGELWFCSDWTEDMLDQKEPYYTGA